MKFKLDEYLKKMADDRRARRLYRMEQKLHNPKPKKEYFGPERRKVISRD